MLNEDHHRKRMLSVRFKNLWDGKKCPVDFERVPFLDVDSEFKDLFLGNFSIFLMVLVGGWWVGGGDYGYKLNGHEMEMSGNGWGKIKCVEINYNL